MPETRWHWHDSNSTVMHATPEWRPVVINTAGNIDHFPPVSFLDRWQGSRDAHITYIS